MQRSFLKKAPKGFLSNKMPLGKRNDKKKAPSGGMKMKSPLRTPMQNC